MNDVARGARAGTPAAVRVRFLTAAQVGARRADEVSPRPHEVYMNNTSNPKLKPYSQKLRREMTKEERHLWYDFLRNLPVTVNRQKVIGPYIVDFYCAKAKLVIELDGSQHYSETGINNDQERDSYLTGLGIHVLRFTNLDISQRFDGVCKMILEYL